MTQDNNPPFGARSTPSAEARDNGLLGPGEPAERLAKAVELAGMAREVIRQEKLYATVAGSKNHVLVEGWTLLGALFGLTTVQTDFHEIEDGYSSTVEVYDGDRVIGKATSFCTRGERRWSKADPYAVASMAQTRAQSKALRGVLGFVVALTGDFQPTPAEEMPQEEAAEVVQLHAVPAETISQAEAKRIAKAVKAAGKLDRLPLAIGFVTGNTVGETTTIAKAAEELAKLTAEQAARFSKWVEEAA